MIKKFRVYYMLTTSTAEFLKYFVFFFFLKKQVVCQFQIPEKQIVEKHLDLVKTYRYTLVIKRSTVGWSLPP